MTSFSDSTQDHDLAHDDRLVAAAALFSLGLALFALGLVAIAYAR